MTGRTEELTRKELIDPALERAGWDVADDSQVGIEIPADGFDVAAWQQLHKELKESGESYDAELPAGICDYVLYQENGQIIAVVEAKRTSVNPALAAAQTEFYVREIEKHQGFGLKRIRFLLPPSIGEGLRNIMLMLNDSGH